MAADASFNNKNASHFYIGELKQFSGKIDYEALYEKKNEEHQNYNFGYYAHLVADDLWLQGFYVPWLKNRIKEKPELLTAYHEGFKLVNAKLIKHYNLNERLVTLLKEPFKINNLQEVSREGVTAFIPFVLSDLQYDEATLRASLTVIIMEQIVGYIETAVKKSIVLVNRKLRVR